MVVFFFFNRLSFRYNDILTYGSRKPYNYRNNNRNIDAKLKIKKMSVSRHCSMGTKFAVFCNFRNHTKKL